MDGKSLDLYDSSFFMDEVWRINVGSVPCKVMAHQAHGTQRAGVPWSTEQWAPYEIQVSIH